MALRAVPRRRGRRNSGFGHQEYMRSTGCCATCVALLITACSQTVDVSNSVPWPTEYALSAERFGKDWVAADSEPNDVGEDCTSAARVTWSCSSYTREYVRQEDGTVLVVSASSPEDFQVGEHREALCSDSDVECLDGAALDNLAFLVNTFRIKNRGFVTDVVEIQTERGGLVVLLTTTEGSSVDELERLVTAAMLRLGA